MTWHKGKSAWYIEHDDGSTISKMLVRGVAGYLLWIFRRTAPVGPFETSIEAKAEHRRMQNIVLKRYKLTQRRKK